MTFHATALPAAIEANVADAAAEEERARRRKRIQTACTVTVTVFAVLMVSTANVMLELTR